MLMSSQRLPGGSKIAFWLTVAAKSRILGGDRPGAEARRRVKSSPGRGLVPVNFYIGLGSTAPLEISVFAATVCQKSILEPPGSLWAIIFNLRELPGAYIQPLGAARSLYSTSGSFQELIIQSPGACGSLYSTSGSFQDCLLSPYAASNIPPSSL